MFPSSLKGAAYHWFYSLLCESLWNFEEVKQAFYHQNASWRELRRNINHLLTIKVKLRESLKQNVGYFQSQMVLVYNCNEDVAAARFISGLQVTHTFYRHLVKHVITKIRDILTHSKIYPN